MPDAARQTMRTWRLFGGAAVPSALIVLTLMAIGVARYPASLQGSGNRLLWTNITLLLTYGLAGIWVWCQRRSDVLSAIRIGATAGLLLGAIFLANHAIELFVRDRDFALVITPVFLAFALLGAVGSAAWQRTRSLVLAAIAVSSSYYESDVIGPIADLLHRQRGFGQSQLGMLNGVTAMPHGSDNLSPLTVRSVPPGSTSTKPW